MQKSQVLNLAKNVDEQIGDDMAEITSKLVIVLLQHEGKFHHPKHIYNIGMTIVTELILRERLILKTRENI